MPMVPGFNGNLRINPANGLAGAVPLEDSDVDVGEGLQVDPDKAILKIEHDDGSITISLDGRPLKDKEEKGPEDWFGNLVEDIAPNDLNAIAEDLLQGVQDDLMSRQDWIDQRAEGMKLLGLDVKLPNVSGVDTAPVEGMSQIHHPLLQEAVLRFQANARSEMLPVDGPVKVRNDEDDTSLDSDELANLLERDMNHYLTVTAKEYYPDTDRMFLMFGFGGTSFKKVYFCPLRNRPVSDSVDADDLIVNQAATDLSSALRVTHRVNLKPSTIKRLQILGVYADIDLSVPNEPTKDAVKLAKDAQQGVTQGSVRWEDRSREVYEVYCELDIPGFEHRHNGKISGLPIPYRVTIDVTSRQILSLVRNYNEETKELPEARDTFVQYTYVPGLGFYGIGLLHILGNATNAVTAAWRELLDAGMFANFPGFLIAKSATRQNSSNLRVPPGGGTPVETNGAPIRDAVLPLPYKEPSTALMTLAENIAQTGMRVGGTSEQAVGEGKRDLPVGTTLALIEQATKVVNSVHKRMHSSQAQEFQMLKECFREHPESLWRNNRKMATRWTVQKLLMALENYNLVPQADPNTASHTQRLMKVMALKQLQATNPELFDPEKVDSAAVRAIGWGSPEQFFKSPTDRMQPSPEILKGMEDLKNDGKKADAAVLGAQAKMVAARRAGLAGGDNPQSENLENQIKIMNALTKAKQIEFQMDRAEIEDENRDKDRAADLAMEQMRFDIQRMKDENQYDQENERMIAGMVHDQVMQARDHAHHEQLAKEKEKKN